MLKSKYKLWLEIQIFNTETAVAGKISRSGSLSASRGTVSKLQTELLALGFKLVSTSTANAGGKVNYAAPQNNTHHPTEATSETDI